VRKDIRLFGNNKTHRTPKGKEHGRRNITKIGPLLDSVRGCPFTAVYGGRGCYGHCYLAESMARYHIKHWVPVPNHFNGQLLAKDLERLEWDFVRNGVMGDPSSVMWGRTRPSSRRRTHYLDHEGVLQRVDLTPLAS